MFPFSLTSRNHLISSFISLMTHWSLSNVFFSFQLFSCFSLLFCCWDLVLMHCDQIESMGLFQFSYICWSLLCALDINFGESSMGCWEMYIVQKLNKIFCRHQLGPFDLWCHLDIGFLYWFFVWMTYLLVIGWY
jgi:hypothetical protein